VSSAGCPIFAASFAAKVGICPSQPHLTLGASAVLLGRLYVWGLAIAGEQGVRDVVQNFLADLDLTMGLSGFRSVKELDASILTLEK
jgi:isopentenyl diphosphate isomerase/L-lactate dehydrogenase-like FMN-dependent dehydrogenase